MKCVLAIDLGGTSLRTALVDREGRIISLTSRPQVIETDEKGHSESPPAKWWNDLLDCLAETLAHVGKSDCRVTAMATSGITRTQVFVDSNGFPVRPAITWADGRAEREAQKLADTLADLSESERPLGPANAFHPLARILWVRDHEPEVWRKTRWVLEPKDFLHLRLTGMAASDLISQSRLLAGTAQKPAGRLFEALSLSSEWVPPLMRPQAKVGDVSHGLPAPLDRLAGLPVFCGSMDTWCGVLGMGAVHPGLAYNVSGTSETFGITTTEPITAPGLVTLPWGAGLFQTGGPSQVGADCLTWFSEGFLADREPNAPSDLLKLAEENKRQPDPLIFLPYLRGERTPLWEPNARGAFLGVNRRHKIVDFVWAILEGVAMANRQVFELAVKGMSTKPTELKIAGGAARSDLWCQVKADVLNLRVMRGNTSETGLIGAALVAFTGLGDFASLEEAQQLTDRGSQTFIPDPGRVNSLSRLYPIWLDSQTAILELSRRLVRASNGCLADQDL